MRVLSIETSCDDTCISIFEATGGVQNASFKMLADNSNSQINIHIPYGGVYPMLAKREHKKNLPILLEMALRDAKMQPLPNPPLIKGGGRKEGPPDKGDKGGLNPGIDLVCVTYGPGLEMCLWEGILFAQDLAKKWNVPLIPVNHMEGHVLSIFGKNKGNFKVTKLKTPILTLLVSGGHTQLVLTKKWMDYEIIGETLDDAVGEAYDKVARMLDLPYPGGPHISRLAEEARNSREGSLGRSDGDGQRKFLAKNFRADSAGISGFSLPRPMLKSPNFNFSYAGLKTAVLYLIKKIGPLDEEKKKAIALEFENAAIECLTYKTAKAIEKYKIKTLIVAGGVAANTHLRRELKAKSYKLKPKILFPTMELARDNSVMIGIAGYLNYIKNKKKTPAPEFIKATGKLKL